MNNKKEKVYPAKLIWKNRRSGGFAALMIVIVLSLILILVSATLSESGFFTRQIISESEFKERSAWLAEACTDNARLLLATGATSLPHQVLKVGSETCDIRQVDLALGGKYTIDTSATYKNSVTNLRVIVNESDMKIIEWKEVASF